MEIKNNGYNVGSVTIDTTITLGVKTEIGTAEDFKKVATLADAGGVIRVHCKVGDMSLDSAVFANHVIDKIDIGSVTNYEGTAYVIAGTASLEENKMYITLTMTSVTAQQVHASTQQTTTKKASSK